MADAIAFNYSHSVYWWLSNFTGSPFTLEIKGEPMVFRSVEHFYQWSKCKNKKYRAKILAAWDGRAAKHYGSKKTMEKEGFTEREDWNEIKEKVMLRGLRAKFQQNSCLAKLLLETGTKDLIEDSPWDQYWGMNLKDNKGDNRLGKLLRKVRKELREGGRS